MKLSVVELLVQWRVVCVRRRMVVEPIWYNYTEEKETDSKEDFDAAQREKF